MNTGMDAEWEEIVSLARLLDHGVASRQGIDAEGVLRLARAVKSFQLRVTKRSVVTPEGASTGNDSTRDGGDD
jgi:hypothetical protein